MKCSVQGCEREEKYGGMCGMHYKRNWRHGNPNVNLSPVPKIGCIVEGCDLPHESKGYCNTHYNRMYKYNRTHRILNKKGNGTFDRNGYTVIWVDGRRMYQHVYLAEKALGKRLPVGAIVHHMNLNKKDNCTPLNLVICPDQSYHMLLHYRMKLLGYHNENN